VRSLLAMSRSKKLPRLFRDLGERKRVSTARISPNLARGAALWARVSARDISISKLRNPETRFELARDWFALLRFKQIGACGTRSLPPETTVSPIAFAVSISTVPGTPAAGITNVELIPRS
jgi:hypothetical protein